MVAKWLDDQVNQQLADVNAGFGINLSGGASFEEQRALEAKASDASFGDLYQYGMEAYNSAFGIYRMIERLNVPEDPNFNLDKSWGNLTTGVPAEYHPQFLEIRSDAEGAMLKDQIAKELQAKSMLSAAGVSGTAATMLSSVFDIDAVLMLASGGSLLAPKVGNLVAKAGITSKVLAGAATTAAAGAEAGILVETANVLARPTSDAQDVLYAGLGGMIFGATLGGIGGTKIAQRFAADESGSGKFPGLGDDMDPNMSVQRIKQEIEDSVTDGSAQTYDYLKPVNHALDFDMTGLENKAQSDLALLEAADKYVAAIPTVNTFSDRGAGKAAKKFYDVISKTPLATDFDRLWNSSSNVAKSLGHIMLESAAGISRNNRSAANLQEVYYTRIARPFMSMYDKGLRMWAKEQGLGQWDHLQPQNQIKAFREFALAMNHNYIHGKLPDGVGKAIKHMTAAYDRSMEAAVTIGKGSPGEHGIRGFEDIEFKPGWMHQKWYSREVVSTLRKLDDIWGRGKGEEVLSDTLSKQYQRLNGWAKEEADIWAKAVVRRAKTNERGAETNVYGMIDQHGVDYAIDFVTDSGLSRADAESLVSSLLKRTEEKRNAGFTKKRGELDLSTAIPGTDLQLVDLLSPDIPHTFVQYGRQVAGNAALARHGVQIGDRPLYKRAIQNELYNKGAEKMPEDLLDAMFDYFSGGAVLGGVDPWVRRVNQVTYLSTLNGLGVTQIAEEGATLASIGIRNFKAVAPDVIKDIYAGKRVAGLEELSNMLSPVTGDHLLHRPELMLEEWSKNPGVLSDLGSGIDKALVPMARMQGYMSGFFKVKQVQQNIGIKGMMHKLYQHFAEGKDFSDMRLYDIGIAEKELYTRIQKYFTGPDPVVKMENGKLNYNFRKWDPYDKEDFALVLNRHTNQIVQKAMAGENTYWMHGTTGSALLALKKFTITALQKQVIRNIKMADMEALALATWGTATASLAYTTREILAGRGEDLTTEKIARGAVGYGNMTGVLAFGWDPLMVMLGQDDMKVSQYDRGGSLFSTPVQLETMSRLSQIPASMLDAAGQGYYEKQDIYNMQAMPLIGNLPGITAVWNSMKDDEEEIKAAREQFWNPEPDQVDTKE